MVSVSVTMPMKSLSLVSLNSFYKWVVVRVDGFCDHAQSLVSLNSFYKVNLESKSLYWDGLKARMKHAVR